MYPKQVKIFYDGLEAAKRASQAYVEANIRKSLASTTLEKVVWADGEKHLRQIEPWFVRE